MFVTSRENDGLTGAYVALCATIPTAVDEGRTTEDAHGVPISVVTKAHEVDDVRRAQG